MKLGDIFFAEIPFLTRPGSKIRPVVIIAQETNVDVLILASTSKFNPNLDLLHSVDFNAMKYTRIRQNGLSGISYFYFNNLRDIPVSSLRRQVGSLRSDDINVLISKLEPLLGKWANENPPR